MKNNRFLTAGAFVMFALVGIGFTQTGEVMNASPGMFANRRILAVKYNENKQTAVNMSGTALSPRVTGKAEVEFKQGRSRVRLEMESLSNPQTLGGFYTTYILWAVAPEGQTESLLELPVGTNFKIESTTRFQTFGLMITAEPHSRVVLPSSIIVAENTLRKGTEGAITTSQIAYSGDSGTFYKASPPDSPATDADYNTPLMILGARRAVEIARRAEAEIFANAELSAAAQKLATLEQAWPRSRKPSDLRNNAKKNSGLAHDVMRIAEQARKLSVERSSQARLSAERQQAGNNIAQAQSEAERSRLEANRAANDALRARVETADANASAREQAARAATEAEIARKRIALAQSEAAKAKAGEGQALEEADRARQEAEAAKRERDAAQQRLYVSLSEILETRREARGLIVNLSDVLFDTGKTTLKPGAREKLSKLSGILAAYSGAYQLEIEGHTDSVGSEETNLTLSRGRAESVHEYLINNGVKPEYMIASQGFGETKPVADNGTAAGRQVNRRVEIIISDQPKNLSKAGN